HHMTLIKHVCEFISVTVYVFTELKMGWDVPHIIANLDTHFNTLTESVTSIWLGPSAFARLTELDHFMKIYPRLTCIFWHRFLTMKSLRAGFLEKWIRFALTGATGISIATMCLMSRTSNEFSFFEAVRNFVQEHVKKPVKVIRNEFDARPEVTEDNQVQKASNSLKMYLISHN
ncbi:hypothetical protein Tco_1536097, partial [Tanacetum coccineum]